MVINGLVLNTLFYIMIATIFFGTIWYYRPIKVVPKLKLTRSGRKATIRYLRQALLNSDWRYWEIAEALGMGYDDYYHKSTAKHRVRNRFHKFLRACTDEQLCQLLHSRILFGKPLPMGVQHESLVRRLERILRNKWRAYRYGEVPQIQALFSM